MKLERISISGLRSIEHAVVEECGGFNVIIGKNNAGKSTVLLAISSFFGSLKSGIPVSINPPIGRAIDFHENRPSPITISCGFRLSREQRDVLVREVISEAPQIRHSVEVIEADSLLEVSLAISSPPSSFAFVRRIQLHQRSPGETGLTRSLLEIGDEAAAELARRARRTTTLEHDIQYIRRLLGRLELDSDSWTRIRMVAARDRGGLRYLVPPSDNPLSSESQRHIEDLLAASESSSAFTDAAESLIASISAQASDLQSEPLLNRIDSLSGQELSVPVYALSILNRIASTSVLYLRERREPIGRKEASQLLELKVRRGGPEKLRAIQETVSALLGVEIDAFRAEAPSSRPAEPAAEMDVDRFLVQVNGAGIREALRLVLDFEFEKPEILLVEEPEMHLHPALETSMMRYLKAAGSEAQIFVTTHSTNFLDTAEMRNVYLTTRSPSTKIQLVDIAEAEESVPRELGIRLSSLFMFDRLVFVEGPSDEDVIREWASILGVNFGQANVGFVSMGGARNFAHYATDRVIRFLSRRQVRMFFILDRDERDDRDVQRLTGRLSNQAELVVLERREIENYLVEPRALTKFIEMKKRLGGGDEHENLKTSEVQSSLFECADALRSVAVERRVAHIACQPLYIDRSKVLEAGSDQDLVSRMSEEFSRQREKLAELESRLPKIIEEQERMVGDQWASRRLELVPGDLLLDQVCRRFDVRFIKERDAARVASFMEPDDVPQEIKRLVKRIGDLL